jgi:hypothetical protein
VTIQNRHQFVVIDVAESFTNMNFAQKTQVRHELP